MAGLSDAEFLLGLAEKIRAVPAALSTFSEGQQADAGGRYIDQAISRGAFSGPEHVPLMLLIDRQKARYPHDWQRGVWNETVYFLCKNSRPFDVSPSTCGRIAEGIEAEAARIAAPLQAVADRLDEEAKRIHAALTAPAALGSAADERKTPEDGPGVTKEFFWHGAKVTMEPQPWHLVKFLWGCKDHRAEISAVASGAWGKPDVSDGTIAAAASRATSAFMGEKMPLSISIESGWVSLSSPK